jgi:hypothetical protein
MGKNMIFPTHIGIPDVGIYPPSHNNINRPRTIEISMEIDTRIPVLNPVVGAAIFSEGIGLVMVAGVAIISDESRCKNT